MAGDLSFPIAGRTDIIVRDTYANIVSGYSASAFSQRYADATDVGLIKSNGTRWIPAFSSQLLTILPLPVGKARTFTGTTNGAFTLGGALANGIAKGYLYFDTNTLNASQPAGFYYVEMSSTTDGIAYNNTYTPAAGVLPTEPGSKTAFSGAVPGGAGFTGAITYMIAQIPAGILGSTGRIISTTLTSQTNNANAKSIGVVLGGTTVGTWSLASTAAGSGKHRIQSHGTAIQSSSPTYVIGGQAANTVIVSTEDTSAAINMAYTLTAGTATDSMVISGQTTAIEVLS